MISHHLEHALEMGSRIVTLVRGQLRSPTDQPGSPGHALPPHYLEWWPGSRRKEGDSHAANSNWPSASPGKI